MKKLSLILTLLTCMAVSLSFGQGRGQGRRGGARGPQTSLSALLRRDDVQADLKVTDDQKTKIAALRGAGRRGNGGPGAGGPGAGGPGAGGPGAGGQRTPPTAEQIAAAAEAEKKQLAEILTPEQITRLGEIRIQVLDGQAIALPDVQKQLSVTDDQKAQIKKLTDEFRAASRSVMEKAQSQEITREDATATIQKNTTKLNSALKAVLTADQTAKLKTLGGKKFEAAPATSGN